MIFQRSNKIPKAKFWNIVNCQTTRDTHLIKYFALDGNSTDVLIQYSNIVNNTLAGDLRSMKIL